MRVGGRGRNLPHSVPSCQANACMAMGACPFQSCCDRWSRQCSRQLSKNGQLEEYYVCRYYVLT